MSTQGNPASAAPGQKDLLEAESNLGQALAVIHRLLPRLEEDGATNDMQAAFKRLTAYVESARLAHQRLADARPAVISATTSSGVSGEIVAAIAAAVATMFGASFKIVSVAKVPVPVPHINVWALEGRTQIFQSHQIR